MKSIAIMLLAANLIAAALPFALAASCATSPPHDELKQTDEVLPEGMYLYVDTTVEGAEKTGPWTESNGRDGLQVKACMFGSSEVYPADKPVVGA